MKSQNLDGEHVLVHNLNPEEVTGEDSSRQYRDIPNPFEIIDIQQSVEEFLEETPPAPPKIETPPPQPKVVANKLLAWCLPAAVREEINPLYGEVKKSVVYGQKFSFETVVLGRNIVSVDFWSPVSIENNSIIYLWDQREWWRVTGSVVKENGWVLNCFPSDHHPSF
jgi:hypothetical protein